MLATMPQSSAAAAATEREPTAQAVGHGTQLSQSPSRGDRMADFGAGESWVHRRRRAIARYRVPRRPRLLRRCRGLTSIIAFLPTACAVGSALTPLPRLRSGKK